MHNFKFHDQTLKRNSSLSKNHNSIQSQSVDSTDIMHSPMIDYTLPSQERSAQANSIGTLDNSPTHQTQTWYNETVHPEAPVQRKADFSQELTPPPSFIGTPKQDTVNTVNCSDTQVPLSAVDTISADNISLKENVKRLVNSLPKNPEDLLSRGWQETTHPSMREKACSREFFDPSTEISVRFDSGTPNAPGFRGKDHYHVENPNRTGKQDYYLDKDCNPVSKGSPASHILP